MIILMFFVFVLIFFVFVVSLGFDNFMIFICIFFGGFKVGIVYGLGMVMGIFVFLIFGFVGFSYVV